VGTVQSPSPSRDLGTAGGRQSPFPASRPRAELKSVPRRSGGIRHEPLRPHPDVFRVQLVFFLFLCFSILGPGAGRAAGPWDRSRVMLPMVNHPRRMLEQGPARCLEGRSGDELLLFYQGAFWFVEGGAATRSESVVFFILYSVFILFRLEVHGLTVARDQHHPRASRAEFYSHSANKRDMIQFYVTASRRRGRRQAFVFSRLYETRSNPGAVLELSARAFWRAFRPAAFLVFFFSLFFFCFFFARGNAGS